MKTIADWICDTITAKVSVNEALEKMATILENDILNEVIKELNNMINNEKTALVVIDMQNDFIDGALGSPEAQNIVPKVKKVIENFNGKCIYITKDYHHPETYNHYIEGQRIPSHCIYNTPGVELEKTIKETIFSVPDNIRQTTYHKQSFGSVSLSIDLFRDITNFDIDTIYIVGLCTDICVISNALMLRANCPKTKIVVLEDCCAGSTPHNHECALAIMQANCIDIIESDRYFEEG